MTVSIATSVEAAVSVVNGFVSTGVGISLSVVVCGVVSATLVVTVALIIVLVTQSVDQIEMPNPAQFTRRPIEGFRF